MTASKEQPKHAADPSPAVQVAFLVNDELAYVNNRPVKVGGNNALRNLNPCEFYIVGKCDNKSQYKVADVIREAVRNGYHDFSFSEADELIVNLSHNCTIDSTAISMLVGLFTKDLALFKKKIIRVNSKNANILEKSPGYIVIKKYIRHV